MKWLVAALTSFVFMTGLVVMAAGFHCQDQQLIGLGVLQITGGVGSIITLMILKQKRTKQEIRQVARAKPGKGLGISC